jgi:nondiscriminating aspartyl-tRNA synthetase
MIDRVLSSDVGNHAGKSIQVTGWVHRIRELGKISFIVLRDRKGFLQLVTEEKIDLTLETVILARGKVNTNEKAPGGYELVLESFEVLAKAEADLPYPVNQDPVNISLEAALDNRMISLRNPKLLAIFRLQAALVRYFGEYLRGEGFTEVKTSKLIGHGTEGGSNLFSVEYFETKVYLAQSPQVYKQAMVCSGLERVFEIGHAYRAEKHDTPRHINEYVSLDVEMGFIENELDLIELERNLLKYIFAQVEKNNRDILELWGASVPSAETMDKAPIIAHDDAKKIASDMVGHRLFEINPEAERAICEWAEKEYGVPLVFVNAFPRKKRPFYTFPDGMKTMSFDCVFRGLEITTGGRRINEYAMFQDALPRYGMTEEELGDYVAIFKYGAPPHGGFAIGLERLTQKILGLTNVKEASLFPRDRKRVTP